ncbi:MAG: type IV pili twitching motility protein PilT, partial [Planctomycetota bacterium]
MSTIQIDRLLDTVIRQNASDLHISVGRKPTLRLHGTLRNLDTKVLDSDDCVALMKAITPERAQQELQEEGSCDFGFAYGTEARFRVAVFRQRGDVTIVLRLIPNKLLTFDEIGLPPIVKELL